jgi:hypothetical protein
MVTNFAPVQGSIVPILIVVAVGILLAALVGLRIARLERRHREPATTSARRQASGAAPVPHAA